MNMRFTLYSILPIFFVSVLLAFPGRAKAGVDAAIEIEAPIQSVWAYVQDDRHASDWSVFFSSIQMAPVAEYPTNLNLTPSDVGFIRRCYRNASKEGLSWDEETIAIIDKADSITKEIRSFNFVGYGLSYNRLSFRVVQEYKKISDTKTELRFYTEPYSHDELQQRGSGLGHLQYRILMLLHRFLAEERTLDIFKKNLENIKFAIETNSASGRNWPHRYAKFCNPENDFWCSGILVDF